MAIMKAAEVRSMAREDRELRLQELMEQLIQERGVAAMGGSPPSPGKIRQLRTAIARIHTINRLEELGKLRFSRKEEDSGAAAEASRRAPSAAAARRKGAAQAPKKTVKKPAQKAPARKPAKKKTTTEKKTANQGGKTGGNE